MQEKEPDIVFKENVTMNLVASLFKHAYRLLDIANHQLLIVVENTEGDRFWSGNGKLRSEFVDNGTLEHRMYRMFELKVSWVCQW